jgi:hypothetical protein
VFRAAGTVSDVSDVQLRKAEMRAQVLARRSALPADQRTAAGKLIRDAVLAGDAGAWRVWYDAHYPRLAAYALVAPGETSIADEHYGFSRPDTPRRAPRARIA